jgi:hypothetical protein
MLGRIRYWIRAVVHRCAVEREMRDEMPAAAGRRASKPGLGPESPSSQRGLNRAADGPELSPPSPV